MAGIGFVLDDLGLFAGDFHLFGVENDDEIAGVDVRGVGGLVFSLNDHGDFGGQSAEDLVGGVDDVPIHFDLAGLWHVSAHRCPSTDKKPPGAKARKGAGSLLMRPLLSTGGASTQWAVVLRGIRDFRQKAQFSTG